MKILITGATGYIGSNLYNSLIKDHEVHVLVRPSSKLENFDFENVIYFDKDISLLHENILNHKIEGVLHLASLFLSSHKQDDVQNLIDSNIFLGTAILEASLNTKVKWFLNTGTFWQHYVYDSEEYNPVNLYAATKQSFIDIAKYYTEISNIKFVTLKLCDTFGPDDFRPKIFNLWNKIAENGEILNMSLGEQEIDLLYIDDVVMGFICLINLLNSDDKLKQNYALYAKKRYKLRELAAIYKEITKKKLNINWGGSSYRAREVMIPWEVGNKLQGWSPQISMEEGLFKIFNR